MSVKEAAIYTIANEHNPEQHHYMLLLWTAAPYTGLDSSPGHSQLFIISSA